MSRQEIDRLRALYGQDRYRFHADPKIRRMTEVILRVVTEVESLDPYLNGWYSREGKDVYNGYGESADAV